MMTTTTTPSLESIRAFRAKPEALTDPSSLKMDDALSLPDWSDDDWRLFLKHTELLAIPAGESLVHRGDADSNLYFVVQGKFEVSRIQSDGISMGPLSRIKEGSVIGEQAFFDGGPRSANVWSIEPSVVLRMSRQQFDKMESSRPKLGRDLIFSLGRILAIRLRHTTARVS